MNYTCQMCNAEVNIINQPTHIMEECGKTSAIEVQRNDAASVIVFDGSMRIGYACRIRGIIHFTGQRGTRFEGKKIVVTSTDSTYRALIQMLEKEIA
jgi:hypothetical protein